MTAKISPRFEGRNYDLTNKAKTDMSEWPPAGKVSSIGENNYFARSEKILRDVETSLSR